MAMDSLDMPLVKSNQKIDLLDLPQATNDIDLLSSGQLFNKPNIAISVEKKSQKIETFSFDFG